MRRAVRDLTLFTRSLPDPCSFLLPALAETLSCSVMSFGTRKRRPLAEDEAERLPFADIPAVFEVQPTPRWKLGQGLRALSSSLRGALIISIQPTAKGRVIRPS